MGRKRHTPEQIITAVREAEVGLARGKSVKLISRELGITSRTVRHVSVRCISPRPACLRARFDSATLRFMAACKPPYSMRTWTSPLQRKNAA